MSAYWNSYNNALAAGQTSIDAYEQGQQRRLAGQAGNALAQGDYGAASGALYRGGDLNGGMRVDQMGQQRQQQAAQVQAQGMDQRREGLKQAATAIRSAPAEQRAQVYQATIRPTLMQLGMPPELLAEIDRSPMDDVSLDAFISALGAEADKYQLFQTRGGDIVRVPVGGGQGGLAYDAPDQPEAPPTGYRWGPDGTLEAIPGGPADPRVAGARAAATRAPARPRAGGGAPVAKLPNGFILDGQ